MKMNDALSRIPWQDFEILVANRYRRHGWQVTHCGQGQTGVHAESEADLRMRRDGELALVQCRHESRSRLDARSIERLLGRAREDAATQVIVFASADLPEDARQLAESGGATIIEGAAVRDMLDDDLLDLRPATLAAVADSPGARANIFAQEEVPRLGRRKAALPLLVASLIFLALLAFYGATAARSAFEHPRPLQVDPAELSRGSQPH